MLSILLTILKIIGFLLLGILGLLLGILLLVLCVPVRYRLSGSYYGELKGQANITWLLHILSVSVRYDKQPSFSVRIFGIPFRERKKKRRRAKAEEDDGIETEYPLPEEEILTVQSIPETKQREIPKEIPKEALPKEPVSKMLPPPGLNDTKGKTSGKKNPIKVFIEKIKFYFLRICDKLKELKLNFDKIKSWVQDEKNKKLVKLLFKQIKFLCRHVLPRKIRGRFVFGFDDPYITGQVLSYLGLFYPLYHKQLYICPVFDETKLEGECFFKGHIRFGTVLLPAVRMLLNQEFRMILKKIMR